MIINYKKKNFLKLGELHIVPGVNQLTAAQSESVLLHYMHKLEALQDEGHLEIISQDKVAPEPGDKAAAEADNPLSDMSEPKAKETVRDTNDEKLLERWVLTENRKGVQDAITKQLEKIAKANQPNTEKK